MVDLLTKYVKFILYKLIIIAEQLGYLLIKEVFADYEINKQIIFDRDKLFTFTFFNALKKLLSVNIEILTIFHL